MLTLVSVIGVDGRKYYYPSDNYSMHFLEDACFSTHGICIDNRKAIKDLVNYCRLIFTPISFNSSIMPVY